MSKARELAELSRTVSDSADAVAITIDSSENVTFAAGIDVTGTVTSDGLTVQTTNGLNALLESTTSYQYLQFKNSSATTNYIGFVNDDFVVNPPTGVKMTVTAEGNVGIGVSNPSDYNASWDDLVVGGTGSHGITIASGTTSSGTLAFADGTSGTAEYSGYIQYNHNTNLMAFGTNGAVAALNIDSSGNVLAGKTALEYENTAGHIFRNDGLQSSIRSGGNVADFNRLSSDGEIIRLSKDGATVGSIGSTSGSMYIEGNPATGKAGLAFYGSSIEPRDAGAAADNAVDLGATGTRFKNLYLSGGIDFNGSSGGINTANRAFLMDEYEIGTCTITFSSSGGGTSLSRQDNTTGFYQKTGNICTVQFYSGGLTFTAAGSGSARIHGLPFNARAGTYNYGVCSITHNTATTTDVQNGFTAPNLSHITVMQRNSTSGVAWQTGGVRYFMFSVTYETD